MSTSRKEKRIDAIKSRKAPTRSPETLEPVSDKTPMLAPLKAPTPDTDKASRSRDRKPQKQPAVTLPDSCTPMIYASVCRDSRIIMDVAVYRLSKSVKRPNTTITHHLPDGFVRVMSGPLGMASIYDYDLVLMAASYLTEAMNRFRAGKGEKPDQVFRPRISDILTFCCKDDGGKQRKAIIGALERLSTTQVKIERVRNMGGEPMVITEGENLIGPFKVISNLRTQKLESVAFKVADWMYEDITTGHGPDVLSVNPDYFLLDGGLARFVYRMARKSAGKKGATWNFGTLYERSGSDSKRNEFNRMLRVIIKNNALPDYSLLEVQGKNDSVLHMENRAQVDKWKEAEE